MDQLLTIEDLAEQFGLSIQTLRYWRHTGTGPKSFKIGRRVRYRACDVEAWLEQQYNATA